VLVDTSVWVDHLRRGNARLADRLERGRVLCHPFVIGELACGNLSRRDEILSLLRALPGAPSASDAEVLSLVESHRLMGRGLGWIDVHLLASALLADRLLWTLDRRLHSAARDLGIDCG
jgi:predicted nucleic acid-binding protein